MAEAVFPDGKVIAVEAVAGLVQGMRETGDRYYPHLLPLITFENVALSDHTGQTTFCYCPQERTEWTGGSRLGNALREAHH